MEIKKCPFCGGEAILQPLRSECDSRKNTVTDVIRICCTKCDTVKTVYTKYNESNIPVGYIQNSIKNTIEAWNRRVDDGRED